MSKPALGRGLGALLGGAPKPQATPGTAPAPAAAPTYTLPATVTSAPPTPPPGTAVRKVPLDSVHPCSFQPRKDFSDEALRELADSIREQGVVQPILVRPHAGQLEIIAGERRWRAARLAGLTEVPILERTASDQEVLELALIENLQRENLNPIEEALGYTQLAEQFQLTQDEIARKVGRSRAVVANALRLLKLPAKVQDSVRHARISVGHAKVLLGLAEPGLQLSACERVLGDGLSVRATEELVARWTGAPAPAKDGAKPEAKPVTQRDPHVVDVENRLRERLGTKVNVRYVKGRGSIDIRYFSDDELQRILETLGVSVD